MNISQLMKLIFNFELFKFMPILDQVSKQAVISLHKNGI